MFHHLYTASILLHNTIAPMILTDIKQRLSRGISMDKVLPNISKFSSPSLHFPTNPRQASDVLFQRCVLSQSCDQNLCNFKLYVVYPIIISKI